MLCSLTACKTEPCQIRPKVSLSLGKGRVISLRRADGRDTRRMFGPLFVFVFFPLVFFFNVRTTQLIHCHWARLISLQGLAENINNVYFISPLEEFVLDISKTYVSSRQRGENKKIILSWLSCAAL